MIITAVVSLLPWFGTAQDPAPEAEAQRPSFLVILTDDQRNDMLSCAGHPVLQTPVMDGLAARGVRFENAFVTTPICAASRASILTARYEASHGFTFGTPPLAERFTDESWPLLLRTDGWRTGHIGKWGMRTEIKPAELYDVFRPLAAPYWRKGPDGEPRHQTDHTAELGLAFLDALEPDQPFALTVSFNAPHAEDPNPEQYLWPAAENGLYEDAEIALPDLARPEVFESLPPLLQNAMGRERWGWRFDTEEKRVKMTRGYYRMISGVDRNLGRLLARLEELGRAENTVVILLGDNGYFLGERGLAGKWLNYEESIRVPLIVVDPRAPEAERGKVLDPLVLNLDVGPTVLGLAGLEAPAGYQGGDLSPWLAGAAPEWRTEFLVEHHMDNLKIPKHRGLRTERWVYSVFYEQDPPLEMLFDLQSDPQQRSNLASSSVHEDQLERLRQQTSKVWAAAIQR